MDKESLHKVNLDALQKELGMSVEDIGRFVQLKNPKGAYKWSKDSDGYGTRPSYDAVGMLLENGATVETLFGIEYTNKVIEAYKKELESKLDPDFYEGLQKSIDAKVNCAMDQRVEYILKEKGLIK